MINNGMRPIHPGEILREDFFLCPRYDAVTLGIELKVWRDQQPDPLANGLEQLDGYLAGLGLDAGWLIIFDRRTGQPPISERTSSTEVESPRGRRITRENQPTAARSAPITATPRVPEFRRRSVELPVRHRPVR